MAVCPLIFCTYLPKNGLFLLIILASKTFYPNWPIFLHGYIPHSHDIFQLWVLLHLQLHCVMWYETVYEEL